MSVRRSARLQQKVAGIAAPKASKPSNVSKVTKASTTKAKITKETTKETTKDVQKDHASVGAEFPEGITLLNQDSESVDVSRVCREKGSTVVIFAYPRASTPGCTRQACGFRDLYPKFVQKDVTVFGLSADSVNAQKGFQTKQKLPYDLLSDPKYTLIEYLGAKKTATGGIVRSHWVVKDGTFAVVKLGVKPDDSFVSALKSVEN